METFHIHPVDPSLQTECEECALGHHSGHLTSSAAHLLDCLVCRAAALPYVQTCGPEEIPLTSDFIFTPEEAPESIPSAHVSGFSSRAPPARLS